VSLQLERPRTAAAAREAVAGLPTVATVEVDERSARLTAFPADGAAILEPVTDRIAQAGIYVTALRSSQGAWMKSSER